MSILTVDDYLNFEIEKADERFAYGDNENQFVDLFLPTAERSERWPVVILIHGGCWRAQYGLAQMGQLARALTKEGVAVCNIEYRRLGNGGGWPNTFRDVGQAADSLRIFATDQNLDLRQVITMGHSAGGHLALWLACRPLLSADSQLFMDDPLSISAVVSLAGIPDVATAVREDICRGAPQELLGGLPQEVSDHYAQGSPSQFFPLGVPHLHLNGTEDPTVPLAYVQDVVERAKASGDAAELIPIEEAGHFEVVSAEADAYTAVRDAVLRFLNSD